MIKKKMKIKVFNIKNMDYLIYKKKKENWA